MPDVSAKEYEYQYAYQPPDKGLDSFLLSSPLTLEVEGWDEDALGKSLEPNNDNMSPSTSSQDDLVLHARFPPSTVTLAELELEKSSVSGVSGDELYNHNDNDEGEFPNDTSSDPIPPKDISQIPHRSGMSVSNGFRSLYDPTPPSQSNLEIYKFDQLGRQLRNDRLNPRSNQDLRCYMQAPLWAAEPTRGGGITRYMASGSKTYDPLKPIATFTNQSINGQGEISVSRISGLGWLNRHRTYFTINLSKQFALKRYRSASGSTVKTRMDRSSSLAPVITTALSWSFTRFLQVHGTPSGEDGQWTVERLDDQIESIRPILYFGTARILEAWNQVRINDEELIISKIDGKNVDASRRVAREKAEGSYVPTKKSVLYEDDRETKKGEEQGEGKDEMEVS
ncbi:hypothetical protein I203_101872 [Kwoniella mangroviensis CBS 8507]|uniref:uncharacterized protein n=1 Tax=Kwoniella mangroviensis CBS 8507 TaxID=1296122 RepID=UPI00080CF524|nr:uncharacterized protein I203_03068 [Kwoniella mangroviensis CBS 8507]OCF67374.1 hypothetical protein I203_03068 [Kwoniella mangroviensis CBS 8507]